MTPEEKNELETLLMEMTEGELSSVQRHRLAEVIRHYPEAKQQYLKYCQVHTMLAWEHGVLGDLQLPDLSDTLEPPSNPFSLRKPLATTPVLLRVGVIVLGVFALAGVILWPEWNAPSRREPGEAVLF